MPTTQQPVMPQTPAEWQAVSARARELQAADKMAADAKAAAEMRAAAAEAERTRTRSLGEHVQDAGIALVGQGVVGLGQAGYGLANMATGGLLDRGSAALGMRGSEFFQDAQQYLESSKSMPMQLRRQHMLDTFKNEGTGAGLGEALSNPTLIADMAMANAAQLLPAVAAGARVSAVARAAEAMPAAARAAKIAADRAAAVAKGASVAEAEATALAAARHAQTAIVDGVRSDAARKLLTEDTMRRAMYGVTAAQTAGSVNVDAVNAAIGAGATPGEAQLLGLGAAVAAGATSTLISKLTGAAELEAAAARSFFNKTGVEAGGKIADRALAMGVGGAKGAAREGVEEYGQSYGEQGFTNLAGAKPFTEDANQAGIMGALVGMPLGGGLGAFNARSGPAAAQGTVFDETAAALEQAGLKASLASKSTQHQNGLNSDRQIINEAQMTGDASQSGQQELALVGTQNVPTVPGPVAPPQLPTASQTEVSPNQLPLGMDLPPEQGNLLGNPTINEYVPDAPATVAGADVSPAQMSLLPPTDLFGDPLRQRVESAPDVAAQASTTADGRQNDLFNPTLPQITGRSSAATQAPAPRPAVTAPVGSVARARQVVAQNQYDTQRASVDADYAAQLDAIDTRPLSAPGKSKAPGIPKTEVEDAIRRLDVSHPITWVESAGEAASAQVRTGKHWKNFLSQNAGIDPRSEQGLAVASAFLAQNPKTPTSVRNAIRAAAGMELERTPQQVKAAAKAEAERVAAEKAAAAQAKKDAAAAVRRERAAAKRDAAAFAETERQAKEAADLEARNAAAQAEHQRTEAATLKLAAKKAKTNAKVLEAAYATDAQMREETEGFLSELMPDQNAALGDGEYMNHRATALAKAYTQYKARAPKRSRATAATTKRVMQDQLSADNMTAPEVAEALSVVGTQVHSDAPAAPAFAANDPTRSGGKQAAAKAKAAAKKAAPSGEARVVTKKQGEMLAAAVSILEEEGVTLTPAVLHDALVKDGVDISTVTAVTAARKYLSIAKTREADLLAALSGAADVTPEATVEDDAVFSAEDFSSPEAMHDALVSDTNARNGVTGTRGADTADEVGTSALVAIDEALAAGNMEGIRAVRAAMALLASRPSTHDADVKAIFDERTAAIEKLAVADATQAIGTAEATQSTTRYVALAQSTRQFGADANAFGFPGKNAQVRNAVAKRAVSLAQEDVNDAARAAPGAARQGVAVVTPQQAADAWTGQAEMLGLTKDDVAIINEAVGNAELVIATTTNPDARFSRNSDDGFGNPMGAVIRPEVWQRMADNAQQVADARGDKLVHVPDIAALSAILGPVPSDVKGAYANGTIYMVQSNITGASDYAMVFAHESAHHGLRSMLGAKTAVVVSRVMANQAMRKRVSARMKQDPTLTRAAAAEEVIVDMHVAGEKLPSGVMAKLRAGVAAFFDTILGVRQLVLSDKDINTLLDGIGRYQNGDHSATLGRIGNMDKFALLDAVMADGGFLPESPMYSRDLQSLEAAISAANGTAARHSLADYLHDAGMAAKGVFAKQVDRARTGGFKGWLLDAMPLDQVRNHYARYFGGNSGPLASLVRRMRAREALTNSTLVTDATSTYEGETITTNPKALADKWGKFNRDGATAHKASAMNELLQVSTLFKVFPNRSGGLENQEGMDYKAAGFTEAQRLNALRTAQRAWHAIGVDGQQIFKESQAMYRHLWATRYEAVARDIVRVRSGSDHPNGSPVFQRYQTAADGTLVVGNDGKPVQTKEFRAAIGDAIDTQLGLINGGPYSPLSRYGDYILIVRDQDGKVVHMSGHASTADRANRQAELFRTGGEFENSGFKASLTMAKEGLRSLEGINHDTIESLTRTVDATIDVGTHPELHKAMLSALMDTYLKSLPQSAFMQHANKRKNIAGASTDAYRAFSEYTLSAARNIAGATHASAISEYAANMQLHIDAQQKAEEGAGADTAQLDTQQAVMNSVKRHVDAAATAQRSEIVDRLLQAGFLSYMVSPSQMFINAMQTAMVAFPRLAGVYGARKSLTSMSAAVKTFTKSRGDMMGEHSALDKASVEGQVMEQLYKDGVFDFTRTNDMAATARGAHHVAEYGTTQGAGTRAWTAGVEAGAKFITASEKFNRQVTALAAVQLEMQANPQTPAESIEQFIDRVSTVADRAVYDSHYDYSQSNKPTHMQSPAGALVTQFMQYQLNTLSMMTKDIIDAVGKGDPEKKAAARSTLAWMLGAQMTFAGTAGTVLAPLVFAAMDLGRDDDDLVDSRTRFVQHNNSLLASGILAGIIDTRRIGADSLIPYFGALKYAPSEGSAKDNMLFHLSQIVGPWFGLVTGTATGLEKVADGDLAGAFGTTGFLGTPKLVVDATKAMDQAYRGVRDGRGIKYDDPSFWDTSLAALGLRSGDRAQTEDTRGAVYSASMHATARKKEIVDGLAKARTSGDTTKTAGLMAELKAWNAAHPDLAIKGQALASAIKGRVQSQKNADAYGLPLFKAPTKSISTAAGLE